MYIFIVIICLALLSVYLCRKRRRIIYGGVKKIQRPPTHIIVDTLNLAHWLFKPDTISPEVIIKTIDKTAAILKLHYPGRVVYVFKDRESQFNDDKTRELYKQAAVRNGVYVTIVERYTDPPTTATTAQTHSSRGRDDFYMSLLAHKYKCPVLTADKLHDFEEFRETILPFHVIEYTFWRDLPQRDFIRPESLAYRSIRKPKTIHPSRYF